MFVTMSKPQTRSAASAVARTSIARIASPMRRTNCQMTLSSTASLPNNILRTFTSSDVAMDLLTGPDPWKTQPSIMSSQSNLNAFISCPSRKPETPLAELKRAIRVQKALESKLPQPPLVSPDLSRRERKFDEEAAASEYQPRSRDIMAAISTLSHSMVARKLWISPKPSIR